MKRILLTALAATVVSSASALAADLPQRPVYKQPAPMIAPAPVARWTGCYIGGNIGGAFTDASANAYGGQVSGDGSGFAGGGQIGCDYEFSGGFVIGVRNMLDYTSNKKSGSFPSSAFDGYYSSSAVNFNNQWFDTLTGRIGYAVVPETLLYFQGGAAWVHTSTNVTYGGIQYGQTSNTRSGWTIGGGVEWMFVPHWSVFLEYNYMDLGSKDANVIGHNATVYPVTFKAKEQTALVGLNFRF